jgi:prepilin peptidase CpaA
MITLHHLTLIATAVLLVISVYTDVRDSKIYNWITVPFAALGFLLNVLQQGAWGALASLEGLLLGLALFFVSALVGRILGAGDCKLFAAIGALLGPSLLLSAILYSLLAGGVFAILIALGRGVLGQSLKRVWEAVFFKIYLKVPMDITDSPTKVRLPYAIAICAGTLFVMWAKA